jgi:hypothetical protein
VLAAVGATEPAAPAFDPATGEVVG